MSIVVKSAQDGSRTTRPNGHMALNHACLPVPAPGLRYKEVFI